MAGYFYFNDDAPPYPGLTYFNSRNWHRGDGTPEPPYGEKATTRQTWRDGSFPGTKPQPRALGPREQIEGEAQIGVEDWATIAGVPVACWPLAPPGTLMIFREVDGGPTYTAITLAEFDQADGFVLTQPGPGTVRIDLNPSTEFTRGVVGAIEQAFLGTSSAETNVYSNLHIVGDSAGTYFGSLFISSTKVLSAQIGSGPNSPKTYLWGAGGDLVFEVGTISDGGTQNAFIFGATGAVAYQPYRVYVRTGSSTWERALTGTVSGLSFAQGLYTGGTLAVSAGDVSGLSAAVLGITAGVYQPLDADLTAIAALTGTNTLYYRSGASTWSAVTIGSNLTFSGGTLSAIAAGGTVTSVAVAVPSGLGVSGSPITGSGTFTFTLTDDLAALEGLSGTGLAARTASNTWAERTISPGAGISVTNGNGVSGNPTITTDPATQAEVEAGTDNAKPITAITAKWIPGVAKFWINFNGTGTIATRVSHNVTSITDNGVGDYTVTIADDFSTADWVPFFSCKYDQGVVTTCDSPQIGIKRVSSNPTAGAIRVGVCIDGSSSAWDALIVCVGGFGDQ